MFVKSHGSAVLGIDALPIAAEVNITAGIGMYLVGLPDNAVRESQERIRAAFENCSYKMSGKKVVVNLSPADIRKEGSAYDLTIALGILAATRATARRKALAVYRDGRAVARRLGAARARSPADGSRGPRPRDSRA